jgi:hypothetical protein
MGPAPSRRSTDVLWSSDWNSATEALGGVAAGYRDSLVNLLCRDINETASRFGAACSKLIHRDERKKTDVTSY